ncbi:DEAD/DEAH box helicase [Brucella sp. HL-2]|uniref:DEAD/DEAH box helicase n=1 Tax=Ochrobactrum quorumnocens TaxID=271865 RepID=A0A5N1JTF7_9HYPH|nr:MULTISPECIES: DEAD/DEAH box helicase [Brucella/Ochrobactrum group]KAA9366429.1 DEAD/DEAH box helicase [[Ochrobactrum] quorumnocens]MBD7992673.1 DEAD/DEAH box helicase [Ochrobactrum gallinarum]MCV9907254.1 DEAD/DEAH box helicase [Brucella sp. HL-2]MDH7793315.1 ATP-dependent RNA helicase RhlE [Ochrobactrum sp. AN78]
MPPKEIELTIETIGENTGGFAALGVTGVLLKGVEAAGMTEPKPIQTQAIPHQLEGRDILGIAQTGSGKTAAFSLPILQKIIALGDKRKGKTARALILAPTRELAVQIEETIRTVAKQAHVSTALILGGVSRLSQIKRMQGGVDVLIATPGRLTDLVRENCVDLSETRWLVLDEADRMLDMGFINDVKRIAKGTHKNRQTALFSATMPKEIATLAQSLLRDPVRVEVAPQGTTAAEITQVVHPVPTKDKRRLLSGLLSDQTLKSVIVFTRTKHGADAVVRHLERDGFNVAAIHGNKSQNARQRALNGFRDGSLRILVATDIAARGIDVPGISHVVNYDLPDEPETYVHRIGRTGRNGASGASITLYDQATEDSKLRAVERVTRNKLTIKEAPVKLAPAPAARADDDQKPQQNRRPGSHSVPQKHRRPASKMAQKSGEHRANPAAKPAAGEGAAKPKRPFHRKRRDGGGGQRVA